MAGEWVQVEGSQYQDLGQVLTAGAIAAGATVYSPVQTGLQWVRNIIALVQIDVAGWAVVIQRGDSSGMMDWGTQVLSSSTATTTSNWASADLTTSGGNSPNNGLIGYQAKFGIKNTSAGASTVGNLRLQFMGQ